MATRIQKKSLHEVSEEEQVRNGMDLLDKLLGPEWPLLINLRTFNIQRGDQCVLGQIGRNGAGAGAGDNETSAYTQMLDELQTINGRIQDFLYERFVWPAYLTRKEAQRNVINQGCGFAGNVSNSLWKEAIRKRQQELGGTKAIKAARKKYYG